MATDNTGTANSPYDAVTTETIAGEIQAAPLNTSIGNLDTAVQSHSHPLDGNVGWDSHKAGRKPPSTGDDTNKWRMVCGESSVTFSGTATGTKTITFATDSDQGDPSFTTVPRIVAIGAATSYITVGVTTAHTTTTGKIAMKTRDGSSVSATIPFQWIAYGKVA